MNYIEIMRDIFINNASKTAIVDNEAKRHTTYEELDSLSSKISSKLISLGCIPGDVVAILLDRKAEYIAAYLGILKAGCCVVSLIKEYPKDRIDYIVGECNAKYIIREDFFYDIDSYESIEPIILDDEDNAFLIYTSGSTGKPKGILHSIAALAFSVQRQKFLFDNVENIIYGATAPMSFIAFVLEYLVTLYCGGTIHILSDYVRKNVREMEKYFNENGITASFISPQLLRMFNGAAKLVRVFTGSERLSGVYFEDFDLYNLYGSSETIATVTYFKVDKKYDNTPIGKAVNNVKIHILDDENNAVKNGEIGEICIQGNFLKCYYKLSEETARKVIKQEDGSVLVHTGDMGYFDDNGNLVYSNRKDWMVKINGQRVETLEIENLLNSIEGITNSVVKAFNDNMGQTYLAAFYTSNNNVSQSVIHAKLKDSIPDYMIPRFFKKLDEMPKNVNGKLDRNALKAPKIDDYKEAYVAPENDIQIKLCKSVEKVLGCGKIGIKDDFISLGGDSIKVLALISEANIEGLLPSHILMGRTIEKISELIEADSSKALIEHEDELLDVYPLTESQLGVYLECINEPESKMYNIPMYCILPNNVDVNKLANAINYVFNNHKVLGITVDNTPQMVLSNVNANIEIKEISNFEEYLNEFIKPFNLKDGPLWRAEILKCDKKIYFIFDIHHIVFDGSSVKVLMNQIADVYNGKEIKTEELTIFDISRYEEVLKDTKEYKEAQKYFENKLSAVDADSRPVPDIVLKTDKGAGKLSVSLNEDVKIREVIHFVRNNGITENTLFLGAFAYALAKFNGARDSIFCTVNNGRHDSRLENSVGMFVKTLPLFFEFDESMSVKEYLKNTQNYFFETMKHDCISFGELASQYSIRADIAFVYQADLLNGAMIENEYCPIVNPETGDVQFDINVMVLKGKDSYEVIINYRSELYSKEIMNSLASMFISIVKGMLALEKLNDIELIDAALRKEIDKFNITHKAYDKNATIVELFKNNVKKSPESIAVIYEEKRLTYKDVDLISDKLAKNLNIMGVGKEDVIAVLIPRSEYIVLCSMGILKACCAYLPLDPTYPPERLNLMVQDSNAKILITVPEYDSIINDEFKGRRIMLSEIENMKDLDVELRLPKPEDLFIMLYTSGSTGLPKGVMLEHRNLIAFCDYFRTKFELTQNSVAAAYASYGFDACMMDLYPTLTAGATVLIVSEALRLDLKALQELYTKENVTNAFITTQVGRQFALMQAPEKLKYLLVGGEKLVPVNPPEKYALYNAYGPTECTVFMTAFHVDKKYIDVPIGKATDNIKLYVTDSNGKLLPVGAVGELWISGPQVSRGYLNRPEQTAAAFTNNPFSDDEDYSRVYHTGDIVRYMGDGKIQFIGRRDAQVKIRGFRIELTEVEEVIRRFEGIRDATVAAFEEPSGGKYIAAYIVSDEEIDIDALNSFILEEKPPYMVPAVTMQISAIPYNQNQKVNKRALPVPKRKAVDAIPPQNDIQQRLFDCISEVVGHKEFGIKTNIYEAGLTSIGAVRLNVALSEEFNFNVKTSDLKENDTILKLEEFFANSVEEEKFEILNDYAISKTQEGIYVESVSKPDATVYNIPVLLEISRNLDIDKLKSAVVAAVNAHPYIKTRMFLNEEGDLRQRRMDGDYSFDEASIEIIKASSLEEIKDNLVKPFKLIGGSLFRVKIIDADKLYILIEMHHIISDGSSMLIFLNDISKAYKEETLEIEKYSGYEVVLNESTLRKSSFFEKAKNYYKSLLADAEKESLPLGDVKKNELQKAESFEYISSALTAEDVKYYCDVNKLGMNAFFTAVFGFVLSKYNGNEILSFASIYNGRSDSRLTNTISMLVKTLPVVINIEDSQKLVNEYVAQVGKQLLDSMTYDIYSFAEISRELGARADVMFAYQGSEFVFDSLCSEPAKMIELSLDSAKAPLNVNVFLKNGKICWVCEYNAGKFSRKYIEGFMEALEKAMTEFVNKKKLKEVSILSDNAASMIKSFNDTETTNEPITANKLFERSVENNPEKLAVICENQSITYRELNENANRVANTLISEGVQPENKIAVIMPRCINAYAARQGVLKSGGAFVPISPEYPDERIGYILSGANAKIIITTNDVLKNRTELFSQYRALCIEDILKSDEISNPNVLINPNNLAYCIFTSGSTGKPKGVMIEHRNLTNFVMNNKNNPKAYGYKEFANSERVVLALAALTFDVSIVEEMAPLYNGATVAMATEEEIHNPILLANMLIRNNVDVIKCTPSYMNNMLDIPQTHEALCKIKYMVIGAEAFPASLYKKLRAAGVMADISNSYGPTEITVSATIDHITSDYITIGGPLANAGVYILDKNGNCLPPYAPGELTITGAGVGRGYVGNDELTNEKFFKYNDMPAYKSGDMARYNFEGKILFMGRMDNQVKLRGLRVELDEIEGAMNSFEAINQSVVLLKGSEAQGQFLCGYYTAKENVDENELVSYLKKSLTEYMVPSVFMKLDKMPMTQNGKVNKKALPEPVISTRSNAGVKPTNDTEKRFCDMFAQVLGIDEVFADDDFFLLGGTSLLASKIAMKCMVENIPVVYKDVFDYSTPQKLSEFVMKQRGTSREIKIDTQSNNASKKADNMLEAFSLNEENLYDVLKYNIPTEAVNITYSDIGNVLVAGSTGFLGIHVVKQLIEAGTPKIYCLVRPGKKTSAEARLKTLLMYYFDDPMEELFGDKIIVVNGDITDKKLLDSLKQIEFDTIINCAACVKHFTSDDILEKINFNGVENLIEICAVLNKKLVQVSTTSIAGANVNDSLPNTIELRENMLDFGQMIDNKYAYTKWKAEKAVLSAIKEKGLRGKIMRVGNLMSREADGEFQANFNTNGFMNRIKAYYAIGAFPIGSLDMRAEFSPVDYTAKAIITLAGAPDKYTVFHTYSCHTVHMFNVLEVLRKNSINIKIVDEEEFNKFFTEGLSDEERNMSISALISYNTHDKSYRMIGKENEFTIKALYRLGFNWPLIDEGYIDRAMKALITLGFFD